MPSPHNRQMSLGRDVDGTRTGLDQDGPLTLASALCSCHRIYPCYSLPRKTISLKLNLKLLLM